MLVGPKSRTHLREDLINCGHLLAVLISLLFLMQLTQEGPTYLGKPTPFQIGTILAVYSIIKQLCLLKISHR